MISEKIYDFFSTRRRPLMISLICVSLLPALSLLRLDFSEDISDFLPLGTSNREALSVYQKISGAERLFILFDNPGDADLTVEAMDLFVDNVREKDSLGWCSGLSAQFDMRLLREMTGFVYENIPYFLEEEDYARMDSLLASESYIPEKLAQDKQALMFPTGGMSAESISRDPLGLFSPVLASLLKSEDMLNFEMYSGHIFTADLSRAIAMTDSPFGNSETAGNSKIIKLLQESIEETVAEYPSIRAHIAGGPQIAVGNSDRIKKDSFLAISLSIVLIVLLLVYAFGSLRNILLIVLSISWGWLFALGGMALFADKVSIIVIGISSVILGIAVNYPLHLIVHREYESDIRKMLREISGPLVIGNVTTVGAFLALVPLKSTALRDLGTFASLLLVGTIVFTLVYLPHLMKDGLSGHRQPRIFEKIAAFAPERNKWFVICTVALTAVLAVFSLKTGFDSNISNINYMSVEQREDMQYFQTLLSEGASQTTGTIYVLSKGDDFDLALSDNYLKTKVIDSLSAIGLISGHTGVSHFLTSKSRQARRLALWKAFAVRRETDFAVDLDAVASELGFSKNAFRNFHLMLENSRNMEPRDIGWFHPLVSGVFSRNVTTLEETGLSYIVDELIVEKDKMDEVKACMDGSFDIAGINASMSGTLSDNFNYIGWACSLIVFIFLWFCFGRLELAIIAFIPMAVSWLWILGIMALLGIKFNIVNVILATFIFGQGDDYTIFITEGCQYEYAYRRPILSSYKSSILQSALIMFVGMGTLIVARHPAMHSLAQVTIIGMASVVLLAWMLPPLLFRALVSSGLFIHRHVSPLRQVRSRYLYKGNEIWKTVRRNLRTLPEGFIRSVPEGSAEYDFEDEGYGERAILLALTHPDTRIRAHLRNGDAVRVAEISAEGFVENIEFKISNK
ncbi:MAG: MMPL family transporter [Bacteroidales bacterium]|nr:MMPL family transporter [Bacteroidales bacterium]